MYKLFNIELNLQFKFYGYYLINLLIKIQAWLRDIFITFRISQLNCNS